MLVHLMWAFIASIQHILVLGDLKEGKLHEDMWLLGIEVGVGTV